MNSILQKACDELAKDQPNIAYVRGMLETLLEMNAPLAKLEPYTPAPLANVVMTKDVPIIEGVPPTMPIDKIKAIAEASAE